MGRRLTVRLPDELVEYLDRQVAAGRRPSRASLIADAVERDRRQQIAERDVALLLGADPKDDLDDLAAYATGVALDDLA